MQRWEKGSQAMVSVNAIFAGFSGALVAVLIAFTETETPSQIQVSISLGLLSVILFALAAEKITDSFDEGKVTIYLYSMLIYNIAVVLLFLSVAVFLFSRCYYLPCAHSADLTFYVLLKHMAVKKDNGIQGLVLSGRGDLFLNG